MLKIVEAFSNDIGTQVGLGKCFVLKNIRGQILLSGFYIETDQNIEAMGLV